MDTWRVQTNSYYSESQSQMSLECQMSLPRLACWLCGWSGELVNISVSWVSQTRLSPGMKDAERWRWLRRSRCRNAVLSQNAWRCFCLPEGPQCSFREPSVSRRGGQRPDIWEMCSRSNCEWAAGWGWLEVGHLFPLPPTASIIDWQWLQTPDLMISVRCRLGFVKQPWKRAPFRAILCNLQSVFDVSLILNGDLYMTGILMCIVSVAITWWWLILCYIYLFHENIPFILGYTAKEFELKNSNADF